MTVSQKASVPTPAYFGLGIWNVYFIGKFALAYTGYLRLDLLLNAAFFLFLLVPIRGKWLHRLHALVALVLGTALLWSESWLPGIDSILANKSGITGFSVNYVVQLAWDFINFRMVGWGFVILLAYYLLRDFVRVTTITALYLVFLIVQPFFMAPTAPVRAVPAVAADTPKTNEEILNLANAATTTDAVVSAEEVDTWYKAFLDYEKDRVAQLPTGISAKDTPFDIIILNICSLSNDDLAATGLDRHAVWSKFDVRFPGFSSATSYSGPATLRLLTAACGQPPHSALYGERRPQCELLNRFAAAGWENRLYLDHNGRFDNYLASLRELAGLTPALNDLTKLHVRYEAFDGSPVYDDADVFNQWFSDLCARPASRTVSLFNLVALHDGNRSPGSAKSFDYAPLAKSLLDDLEGIMNRIEKSGRPVLFIVVPEHGAAVRGDKIQMARLREIPSPKITNVPVLVKFFGLKLDGALRTIEAPTSYLALAELMARTATSGVYRDREADASAAVDAILMDLPQTWPVSQNANASVVRFAGVHWVRLHAGKWIKYPE